MIPPGLHNDLGGASDGQPLRPLGPEQPQERCMPPFDCADYSMLFFKVLPCLKKYNHDWTACPGAHPGERARRRCLLAYKYGAKVCPDMQTHGTCPRGEACYMTHGMFEYYMHPLKYKTKMCKSGPNCRRHYCFFSHSPEEMRESTSIPDSWQLQIQPDGSFSTGSVAQVLACLPVEARAPAQAAIAQLPQIMAMFEAEARAGAASMQGDAHLGAGWAGGGPTMVGSACMQPAAAVAGSYGPPPGMVHTLQQAFHGMLAQQPQQQQQQEYLQYGAACGLSNDHTPQHHQQPTQPQMALMPQPAGAMQPFGHSCSSTTSSQSTLSVVMPGQQGGIAAAAAPASGSPVYPHGAAAAAGLQGMAGGWNLPAGQGAPSYAPTSAAAVGAQQPWLQSNYLVQAQGSMVMQHQQQQQVGNMRQVSAPQQQPVSGPVPSSTVLMCLQQPQFMSAAGLSPQASGPPQPIAVAPDDPLVQQLQALGLATTSMPQQLH